MPVRPQPCGIHYVTIAAVLATKLVKRSDAYCSGGANGATVVKLTAICKLLVAMRRPAIAIDYCLHDPGSASSVAWDVTVMAR